MNYSNDDRRELTQEEVEHYVSWADNAMFLTHVYRGIAATASIAALTFGIGYGWQLHRVSMLQDMMTPNSPGQFELGQVDAVAQQLQTQAQKDIQSPESVCFQRTISCPLSHYQSTAEIRLEALKQLNSNH